MNLGQELVCKLIKDAEQNEFAYNDHHAEQYGKDPEINIAQILHIRVDKETGYYREYPGNEKYRVFFDSFQHSEQILHPKEQGRRLNICTKISNSFLTKSNNINIIISSSSERDRL
jgi:hypothetical protein